ncbi:MAG TPA: hypothetical protein VIT91_15695 [Chthoniobacterales bacterium]
MSLLKTKTGGPPGATGRRPVLPMYYLVIAVTFLVLPAYAQETVIIPYDASKPVSQQQPNQRYVPYERFLELWEAAKAHRRGPIPPDAPQKYTLDNARHDAVLDGRVLTLTSALDFHTFGNDPVEIPLQFGGRNWLTATLDGAPAPFENGKLLVTKPGIHQLVLTSTETLEASSTKTWLLRIPKTPAGLLTITLPDDFSSVTFAEDAPVLERVENSRKIVSRVLAGATDISVNFDFQERRSRRGGTAATLPASARLTHRITTGAAWENIETTAEFDPNGTGIGQFALFVPADLQPTDIRAPGLRSWKLTANADADGRTRLDIVLLSPVSRKYAVTIITERPVPPGKQTSPFIGAEARRVDVEVTLQSEPGAEFLNVNSGDAQQTGVDSFALARTDATISYETKIREIKRDAVINAVYQVNRSKIDVVASIRLRTKETNVQPLTDITLAIPSDFDVETVQGGTLRDWWRDSKGLHLRFHPRNKETALVVYLVKQFGTPPKDLELLPIRVEGFQNVTGEAVIAAHKGDEAALQITGAIEVAPEKAAKGFTILPPLERKRAFTFSKPDFHGKVTLAPRPVRMSAAWVTHVQAHEGWLGWRTKARFVVRQGSTRNVTFSLPEKAPEARITGPEVREVTSKIDDERRVYTVALQNDLISTTDITIDLDQPATDPVAGIEFSGLERQDGYIAAENVSEYEMTLQPRGLDTAQPTDLPFIPPLTIGASIHRAPSSSDGWALGVALDRLEKTGSRAAFVSWVEITTAIREDGTEWNRAVYHLQNRSLQFLPVRLPADTELITARVAGENTRADSGQIDGKSVLLIPLIKTRPGDISYDVELVYRRVAGSRHLRWLARRELDDPDLPGITVERTLWNLRLPEKYPLLGNPDRAGNMETVIAEVNQAEKWSGMLEELKSLGSIASSSGASRYSRNEAQENFDNLARQLDKETAEAHDRRGDAVSFGKKGKREIFQTEEASKRRSEIQSQIEQERKKQGGAGAATKNGVERDGDLDGQTGQYNAKEWNDNAVYKQKADAINGEATATENLKAAKKPGTQLLLNDNIALDQSSDLSESGTDKALNDIDEVAPDRTSDEKAGQDAMLLPQQQAAFGAARGNAVPELQAAMAPAPATAPPALQRPVSLPQPALQQLGLQGRVSLNAAFPLEGREYHFKKLKSNARLDFRIASEPAMTKLANWAWFAGLAFTLGLIMRTWKKVLTSGMEKRSAAFRAEELFHRRLEK